MSDALEFDWQPLSALRPLLCAVEGMLEAATSQRAALLRDNQEAIMIKQIRNTYTQRQSYLGLYQLQCERWRKETSLPHERQALSQLEAALAKLASLHQQILSAVQGC